MRASIKGVLREGADRRRADGSDDPAVPGQLAQHADRLHFDSASILVSLIVLSLTGNTINIMTLGGLALAVGILVDDATVEIENTHRNMGMKKPLVKAVLDGAQQVAVPAFVSTLAICIVFVPVLLLTGAAQYLFTPLALAVVFAMLASYLLSRTLIPEHGALPVEEGSGALLRRRRTASRRKRRAGTGKSITRSIAVRSLSRSLRGLLDWALDHRGDVPDRVRSLCGWLRLAWCSSSDATSSRPWIPARSGFTCSRPPAPASKNPNCTSPRSMREIREVIPADELDIILDNIGLPNSGINLAFGDNPVLGNSDGDILVSLKREARADGSITTSVCGSGLHAEVPGLPVLLRSREYHQSDSELRTARAHRSCRWRAATRFTNYNIAQQLQKKIAAHSRRGGCHHSPGGGLSRSPRECRPLQGRPGRSHGARCLQQPADFAEFQRPDRAEPVAELSERRELSGGGADSAVSDRFLRCPDANADYERRRQLVRRLRPRPSSNASTHAQQLASAQRQLIGTRPQPDHAPPTAIPGAAAVPTQLLYNLATLQRGHLH